MKAPISIVFCVALLPAFGAFGANSPTAQGDDTVSLQLGKISVKGQR